MATNYIEQKLNISENQKEKIKLAMKNNEAVTIRVENVGDDLIALTKRQINQINNAFQNNKGVNIKLSKAQLAYNKNHVQGGFIGPLLAAASRFALPLLSKAIPALSTGVLSGLASTGINKLLGGGIYMKRDGNIYKIQDMGSGIYLKLSKPNKTLMQSNVGNGLYLKDKHNNFVDGSGLISDLVSNVPLLNLIF